MTDPLILDAHGRASALIAAAEETVEAWYVEAEAEVSVILDRALATSAGAERLLAEARAERASAERLLAEAMAERACAERVAREAGASRRAVADAQAALIRATEDEIVRRRAAADQALTAECEQIRDDARAAAEAETDAARARARTIVSEAEGDATVLRAAEAEYVARQMRDADQAAAAQFAAADAAAAEIIRQAEATAADVRDTAEAEATEVRRAAVVASRRLRLDAEHQLGEIATRLRAEDGRRHAEMSRLRAALDRALGSPLAGFDLPTTGLSDLAQLEDEVLAGIEVAGETPSDGEPIAPIDGRRPFEVPDDLSALTGGVDPAPRPSADLAPPAVGSRWRRWLHRV